MSVLPKGDSVHIREVWNDNLEEEFALIREVVDTYNYVAMDTEFPGVVLRPVGSFKNINDYNYQTLKDNVDMLKLIQLGLTFSDENGNLPTCGTDSSCIWQFNFCEFDISQDIFASDSIELLHQCGIDFKKNNEKGIDVKRFGELLMSSGIVLNDGVNWVTFHSGYDFGYLLKLLTCRTLPDNQAGFFDLINMYFPMLYDIKHMMKFCNNLHGGLNKLAELLEVERVGVCHQAGSDSLLTWCTFRKLRDNFFNGSTEKYAGVFIQLVEKVIAYSQFIRRHSPIEHRSHMEDRMIGIAPIISKLLHICEILEVQCCIDSENLPCSDGVCGDMCLGFFHPQSVFLLFQSSL
ncbi:hypothetical protein V6N13_010544 [Hibiscus sabdariffa]